MGNRFRLIPYIVLVASLSLPAAADIQPQCKKITHNLVGYIAPNQPFAFTTAGTCNPEGLCTETEFHVSLVENSVQYLLRNCDTNDGKSTCQDYQRIGMHPTNRGLEDSDKSMETISWAQDGTEKGEVTEYRFKSGEISIGSRTDLTFEINSEPSECLPPGLSQSRTIMKTHATDVYDEFNPYPGNHPGAINRSSNENHSR